MLRQAFRMLSSGASWQNPAVAAALTALDPVDYAVRRARGLGGLPRYSVRVRSNGLNKQFGGRNFARYGNVIAGYLRHHAGLIESSRVLDIGCGCGRVAFALLPHIQSGSFDGVDIEPASIAACQDNPALGRFRFHLLDIHNEEYNPAGRYRADEYVFPFADESFDVIYLVSVFTHMLTRDVEHYIAEIGRMLAPGGTCMATTFLMDYGREGHVGTFAHTAERHFFVDPKLPEIAVGYEQAFFDEVFAGHGMERAREPLFGSWRGAGSALSEGAAFGQDALFFTKA